MRSNMRHDLSTYLLGDALPSLLDGRGVTDEGGGHLESLGRDVADGRLDVVGDPLHEVRRVLVHHVQHLGRNKDLREWEWGGKARKGGRDGQKQLELTEPTYTFKICCPPIDACAMGHAAYVKVSYIRIRYTAPLNKLAVWATG